MHDIFEDRSGHNIEVRNHLRWEVQQLIVQLLIVSEEMVTINVEGELFSFPAHFEFVHVEGKSRDILIVKSEVHEEHLDSVLNIISVDVSAIDELSKLSDDRVG